MSALPAVGQLAANLADQLLHLLAGEMNQERVAAGCGEAHHAIGDASAGERLAVEVNVGVALGADVHLVR